MNILFEILVKNRPRQASQLVPSCHWQPGFHQPGSWCLYGDYLVKVSFKQQKLVC